VTSSEDRRLIEIARRLDRLRRVPTDVLGQIVTWAGRCMWAYTTGEPPQLTGCDTADRELAARLCDQCPVQDECLEFELRMAGEDTAGVWGALDELDRRALYPHWRRRGDRADDHTDSGEPRRGQA
jgi:WhiB family transcriptional regulator, redox-sensing transcriptional regulator